MRLRLHPAVAFTLLACLVLGLLFGIDRWRPRAVFSDTQLFSMLPSGGGLTFLARLDVLRQSGLMKALRGVKPAEDGDYQAFLSQTNFDYTRDLDLLAGYGHDGELFFIARGRFNWQKLRRYAQAHGGTCSGDSCETPASTPGHWASFGQIQADAIALAVGTGQHALKMLHSPAAGIEIPTSEPAWLRFSPPDLLQNGQAILSVPGPLRIFAVSLTQAQSVLISFGAADANSGAAFCIRLDAVFENQAAAQAAGKQLQLDSNMLKLTLLRTGQKAADGDLASLLAAGTFEAKQGRVYGSWPVSEEMVRAIE